MEFYYSLELCYSLSYLNGILLLPQLRKWRVINPRSFDTPSSVKMEFLDPLKYLNG